MASKSSTILSADEVSALLQKELCSFEESDGDEDSDDGSIDGDLVEGDYTAEDGSQMLVDSEILSQIRSSTLFVANEETLPSHRDSLLLFDPELCAHEEDPQEGTSYNS